MAGLCWPGYRLGTVSAVCTLAGRQWLAGLTPKPPDWHLLLHLAFECQLLAGLLFFTGGATNPFISYFLVLLVVSAYSLPVSYSLLITVLCIADYSLLTQWFQPLLSNHVHGLASHNLFDLHLAGMWLTFVISALIVVTFIPLLLKSSQQQQQEIQQLREQQLKNEQLIGTPLCRRAPPTRWAPH